MTRRTKSKINKMKKIKPLNLVIVSLFSFLLASCNITANTKRLNRTEDKQAAEEVTSLLYSLTSPK
jgi:CHASE1-domain containing sensor protein